MSWKLVCQLNDIPKRGARVVNFGGIDVALFRTGTDTVFALRDQCPHRGGPLSQGIVFGETVACPLHNWKIDLATGEAKAPDHGCTRRYTIKIDSGNVLLDVDDARNKNENVNVDRAYR